MLKRIVLIVSVIFCYEFKENHLYAQDPEFTQFYANPLYLNPAFAGTARCPRINLNYRNQWPAISGTFVTYSASYDQHFDKLKGGLGLIVLNDKAGVGTYTTTNVSGIYSYQLNVNREFSMNFGFQATYFQRKLDWSKLTFGDMINPTLGFIYESKDAPTQGTTQVSNVDFSAGLLGYSKRYFFGFTANHLTQPNESLIEGGTSPLPLKLTVHAGALLPVGDKGNETSISPNVLYQKQQNFQQLNVGLYLIRGAFVGGIWYRSQDAFIFLIGLQQHFFKLGYSYDLTVSKLTNATGGSHEVSFSIQFECKPKKKKFRTVSCPSF